MTTTLKDLRGISSGIEAVFFDCETGGFSPQKNGLTEVAAVHFTIGPNGELKRNSVYNRLIKPVQGKEYHPQALNVQNRTYYELSEQGEDYKEVIEGLHEYFVSVLGDNFEDWAGRIWAHNAPFDHGFVLQAYKEVMVVQPIPDRCNWSCTKSLATIMRGLGFNLPTASTNKALAEFFGVTTTGQHGALVDTKISIEVLSRLLHLVRG